MSTTPQPPDALALALANHAAWHIPDKLRAHKGYALGCRYPSLSLRLEGRPLSDNDGNRFWAELLRVCPAMRASKSLAPGGALDWSQTVTWLLTVWQQLQLVQGIPVFEAGRVVVWGDNQAQCQIPVSAKGHKAMARVIHATVQWLAKAELNSHPEGTASAADDLLRAVSGLSVQAVNASNPQNFVKAAFAQGLPMMELPGGVLQYGVGAAARRLISSFTDATPVIAAKLARNKMWASALLADSGLPVPPHYLVADADACVKAAQRMGYPVVVKPADLDGGVGVAAGLEDEAEVRLAFAEARKLSNQVLLEKHVHGRDYRLVVFEGELIWTVERIPGGITGDGAQTVAELLDQLNADPRRSTGLHAPLKRVPLDAEAAALLARQGLKAGDVPAAGRFVRLRRTANVATGGQPLAVQDQVHPDNAKLAVRAAEALGLDVAGIDLLIDDISRSWRDCGAAVGICEVNGQPNLGQITSTHLYGHMLKRLVPGGGRVPTILVLGAKQPAEWLDAIAAALGQHGLRVGLAGPSGVSLADESFSDEAKPLNAAGRILALNRRVDAMVLAITEDSALQTGLPWAHYDALILAGDEMPAGNLLSQRPAADAMRQWLSHLLPACDGWVIASKQMTGRVTGMEKVSSAQWQPVDGSPSFVAGQAVQLVLTQPNFSRAASHFRP